MKKRIVFKDSTEGSEISLLTSPDNDDYILTITSCGVEDVWFHPEDFAEFLNECQRFYIENEKQKNELPQGEK